MNNKAIEAIFCLFIIGLVGCQQPITTIEKNYTIGIKGPAGGFIFYDKGIYSDGWQYLEVAPTDQSTGIAWSPSFTLTTATGTAVGTGKVNTTTIVNSIGAGNYAAQLCNDLVLGGYNDWFLPSMFELSEISMNLFHKGIGGFNTTDWYWSSSDLNTTDARDYQFGLGSSNHAKPSTMFVRAIRQF